MYTAVKKLAYTLIPKRFLLKNELFFRSLFAQRYKGKNHTCPICEHSLKSFITLDDGDLLCPFCGSRSRTRRLYGILTTEGLLQGKVLHFSPSRSLYRKFSKNSTIAYSSTDYEDEFIAEYKYDITDIDCADNSFNVIICYHILEHIENDLKAMEELYRVLQPGGTCLVQTPFKEGTGVYEDDSITSETGRLEAFGQEDHVRIYSVDGLKNRLLASGFTDISVKNYGEEHHEGLAPETVLFLKKPLS